MVGGIVLFVSGATVTPEALDHPGLRRRALAARVGGMAERLVEGDQPDPVSLTRARRGGRELGVYPPVRTTPSTLRSWADRLERANTPGGPR
jgi:hypothetical protein